MSAEIRFTKDHEWVRKDGARYVVGITDYAQRELGDVVFVDLPAPGKEVERGGSFAQVESVKAVSDVYAPLSGRIVAVNENLSKSPELVNNSPVDGGWFVALEGADAAQFNELMSEADYANFTKEIAK